MGQYDPLQTLQGSFYKFVKVLVYLSKEVLLFLFEIYEDWHETFQLLDELGDSFYTLPCSFPSVSPFLL